MKHGDPISIIVPTLNEAGNLPLLFKRIDAALANAHIPYEIIVVDDRSTDATPAIAENAPRKYGVRLRTKRGKRGKAYSLLEGFAAAKYDLICMVDADLQYPPEAIPSMYHKMQFCEADIIITKRVDNETSRLRKLSSAAFHAVFTRALFGINYDTQSGLKLFKKRVLQDITVQPTAWTFDLEFIVRSLEKNYVILSEDIPFSERHSGVTKLNLFSSAFEGAWQSLRLWRSTSVRRVKAHYKRLQPLQRFSARTFGSLLSLAIITGVIVSGVLPGHSYAASTAQPVATTHKTVPKQSDDNLLNTVLTGLLGLSSNPSQTTPAASTTEPAATSGATSTTTSVAQPSATAKPAAAAAAATKTTSTAAITTATAATPVTNTTDLAPQTGKQAAYYPQSKLAPQKTNQFLRLAVASLEIGGVFMLIGILVVLAKKIRKPHNHNQPVWNN